MTIDQKAADSGHPSALKTGLACVAGMLLGLFLLVRWSPDYIQTASGDDAFTYTFQYAFARGIAYGSGLFHTAGPWSIIYFPQYYPETFFYMLAGQAFIAVLLTWALLRIALRNAPTPMIGLLFFVGGIGLLGLSADNRFLFLSLATVLFLPDFRSQRTTLLHFILMIFAALAFLVKGTFLLTSAVVLVVTLLGEFFLGRRFPFISVVFLAALFAFGAAAGQSPADVLAYISLTFDVSSGYPERFSELGSPVELVAFAVIAAVLWAAIWIAELIKSGQWGAVVALAYGAILFTLFKTGFMRQDGQHVIRAFCTIFVFAPAYVFVNRQWLMRGLQSLGFSKTGRVAGGNDRRSSSLPLILASVFGGFVFILGGYFAYLHPSLWSGKVERIVNQAISISNLVTHGRRDFDRQHQAAMARVRAEYPWPQVPGSVAVFSSIQTPALANAMDYRFLPTASSYLATTPKADAANAQFFSDKNAPAYIFFRDTYYANTQTGLAILKNYRPADTTGAYLILKRGVSCEANLSPIAQLHGKWEQPFALLDTGGLPIWAEINYEPTWLNRLLALLFQPSQANLILYEGQKATLIRINKKIAQAGMMISPILYIDDFAKMFPGQRAAGSVPPPVTSVRLRAGETGSWLFPPDAWERYFKPDVEIKLFSLKFDCPDLAGK